MKRWWLFFWIIDDADSIYDELAAGIFEFGVAVKLGVRTILSMEKHFQEDSGNVSIVLGELLHNHFWTPEAGMFWSCYALVYYISKAMLTDLIDLCGRCI